MFHMHLQQYPFELIQSGKKTIELRLYDSTRQKVKIGDYIEFTWNEQTLLTKVVQLYRASNFKELYEQLQLDPNIYKLNESTLYK